MTNFSDADDLQGATFFGTNLRGARFAESDLSGVVMRGVEFAQVDIDAPWLPHGGFLRINGVDVIAYVEAELDKRFPGRELRRATDPRASARPTPRPSAPGRPRSSGRRHCPSERSTSRSTASGRSPRRCVTSCTQPTSGWARRPSSSTSRSTRSACATPPTHAVRPARPTPTCSRSAPSASPWCVDFLAAVTSEQLDETRRTPTTPTTPRPSAAASTSSSRRSGSTTASRSATSTRSRRRSQSPSDGDSLDGQP